jgi:Fic family protein
MMMRAFRTTIVTAMRLASRRRGVTAPELAKATGCPASTARRTLALLARDGVLLVEVPERKGKQLGDWRNAYRMARVP